MAAAILGNASERHEFFWTCVGRPFYLFYGKNKASLFFVFRALLFVVIFICILVNSGKSKFVFVTGFVLKKLIIYDNDETAADSSKFSSSISQRTMRWQPSNCYLKQTID